jgi:ABC-type amino acid transport substrate-binding protein
MHRAIVSAATALLVAAAAAGCTLPRDSDGTLDRVRGKTLRVGLADSPPWVVARGDSVSGVEVRLVGALAEELHARPEWHRGSESGLLEALHERELDVVVGGLTADSPWAKRVAFTEPYQTEAGGKKKHVLALPPGENAWLVHVERFLRERGSTLANAALRDTAAPRGGR